MPLRILYCIAVLCLTFAATGAAQPAGPSVGVQPEVARATLSNGLRVVVVPDRLAPVVSTELSYLAGSNDAPPDFPGTAHALEHMMFRGSQGLDKEQLFEIGARLGGIYNASTTETVTQYTFTVPADDLGLVLRIEALRMRGATIAQADWEQERGAIEQEVSRDLSSPGYAYFTRLQAILFAGTPYAHDALGTRASFDRTDAAMLRRFYEQWYAPNNAILVIAGDVDPPAAIAQAQAAFGDIPPRALPEHATTTPGPVESRNMELPTDLPTGVVSVAFRAPGLISPDFAAFDILGDVLNSQRGGLRALVPAGRALSVGFVNHPLQDVGFAVVLAAFPKGGDPGPVLADIRQVLAAARDGVPPELVDAARRHRLARLAFENDSISGLARTWSSALAFQHATSAGDDIARAYAAVTVDDVNRMARALLDPADAVIAILTPEAAMRKAADGGFGGAESFAAVSDYPVALPDWAAAALATLRVPEPLDPPDVSLLPNGLRLIVQPEHVGPTVSVYGWIRSEPALQEPPGQEGVAALTGRMFDGGSEAMDRLTFRKAVDDIAATVTAGSGFSLQVLAPDFARGMALLADNELRPAFPAANFAVARTQLAQSLAGSMHTPGHLFGLALERALLPPDDPMLRQATPATVSALQLDDVRAFYRAAYRPDLTTIVVIGDVTPAEARRVVADSFGSWQATGPTPVLLLPPVAASTRSEARIANPGYQQDRVLLTETLGNTIDGPDRFALELGNIILGGGSSSRLYQDLRVRTGYVYEVASSVDLGVSRSSYSISFGADAASVQRARALAERDIRIMQTTPVSEAQLNRAKALALRRMALARSKVGAIAAQYLRSVALGLPLDDQDDAAVRLLAVTAPDIQAAFGKWVRPDDLAQVVEGPPLLPDGPEGTPIRQ